jgi:hypothetical protein
VGRPEQLVQKLRALIRRDLALESEKIAVERVYVLVQLLYERRQDRVEETVIVARHRRS